MRPTSTCIVLLIASLISATPALADKKPKCAALEDSQRDDPDLDTQWELATCYADAGKLASALKLYKELGRTASADRRKQATERAAKLAPRVPKLLLKFQPRPDGIRVFMDSIDAVAFIDVETPIDPGSYKLAATAPGFGTWRKTIEVEDNGKVLSIIGKLPRKTAAKEEEDIDTEADTETEPETQPDSTSVTRSSASRGRIVNRITIAGDLGFLFVPQAYRAMGRLAYGRGELFDVGLVGGGRGGDLDVEAGGGIDARIYLPIGGFCRAYGHAGVGYWTTSGGSTNLGGGVACQDWKFGTGPQLYVEINKEFGGTGGGILVGFGGMVVGTHE